MNDLAHFKAKYAISYPASAKLFNVKIKDIRDWIKDNSTPNDINEQISLYSEFADHLINEHEIFGDDISYIKILEHDKEILIKEKESAVTESIKLIFKVKSIKNMNFIDRLKFLFSSAYRENI